MLKWLAEGMGYQNVSSTAVFYALRALMFVLSFVLEDWALHELLPVSKDRRVATLLVASSYVTWTYQTHTFSNSIETLIVLWCLVLISRIIEDKVRLFAPDHYLPALTQDSRPHKFLHPQYSPSSAYLAHSIASPFQRFL